jgi:metallophosphoesterase (TIGR00282 family)
MSVIRVGMIGDVVGDPGLQTLEEKLPVLIREHNLDFVTVNGENAADGFGMTEIDFRRIMAAGADIVTSGNHVWEKRDFWTVLENEKTMLRPANYNAVINVVSNTAGGTASTGAIPGRGFTLVEKNGVSLLVINLQGREMMNAIDCPFQCFDRIVNDAQSAELGAALCANTHPVIIVDFHAESSREKEALAYYADGRASVIAGTHTHVQTADERIMPKGSAYITDLGMTGITNSVIGMDPKICSDRFHKQVQFQMKIAMPDGSSNRQGEMRGIVAEIDTATGKALSIKRI